MIRLIKVNNLIYENIEPKILVPTEFDGQGNPTQFEEQPNPAIPQDLDSLKQVFKDTISWYTDQYIGKKLSELDESLPDLQTEIQYKELIFASQGIDINSLKQETLKILQEDQDLNTLFANLNITDEQIQKKIKRYVYISQIIYWKEQIWIKEEELEAQIDTYADNDSLLELNVPSLCEEAYQTIPLVLVT